MLWSAQVFAPENPPRQPSKSLLLAEKLHRASQVVPRGWISRPNHIKASECIYKFAAMLGLRGHEEIIASLIWVESRYKYQATSRIGAKGIGQIHPKWRWMFERELWKVKYIPGDSLCDEAGLAVAAYKLKLKTAKGEPIEAVRIYNHGTHPFSYVHQRRVLTFYNVLVKQ